MTALINASTSSGVVVTSDTSGSLAIQNNGTTAMTVTSGSVGIGTTSPSATLHVNGGQSYVTGASGAGAYSRWYNNAQTTSDFQVGQGWASASDNVAVINNNANAAMIFGTNGTERMRIDSSGNLLINTTSGNSPNCKLFVQSPTSYAGVGVVSGTNGNYGIAFYPQSGAGSGAVGGIVINASTVSYNTSSDYRLKENIAPMTGALAKVAELKPVTYKWKADGKSAEGFIAHELAEVCPDAVTGEKDAVDADGNPKYQGIDTSFLVATLTAAIQELKAELDATKAEVAALKGTV